MIKSGALYIVATPIGNLEDITIRAITVLKEVQLIAAEDTRQSRKLLQHYGIKTPLYSLHAHNEKMHSTHIIAQLKENRSVAYITDAGTPLISDPGATLVRLVREQGLLVQPIPGPSAAIAALSIAGFSTAHFYFEGFLPNRATPRKNRLRMLAPLTCTLVFYESCHRITAMLRDSLAVMGNRDMVLAREMTKKYETILAGKIQDVSEALEQFPEQRLGEFVVMLAGNEQAVAVDEARKVTTLAILLAELPLKRAVSAASKLLGISKNELYALALKLSQDRM
jgi:16S rRNA (cytidine1402-2'-O)-methyltransferase